LAELSLDHFQRLCDSSLALLRANSSDGSGENLQFAASVHHMNRRQASHETLISQCSAAKEAGELLANAASQWAAEDVESASASNPPVVEDSSVTLLDEIYRLRLQLSMQHMRVVKLYADGVAQFTKEHQLIGAP
jgi:hypothetical protein